ncbi:hypothetical protein PaeCFBP13512_22220 [Paenibacillus sp. CFBP13512]|uniref:GmrSD restriction endonuclease domain-containing protein n=1 Tax=Paenibacillus sp. CFBP13512 TaxID=2184007 RepID=UPI0010C02B88|nr:DUF262 domain-containing protein [Paenibacillus sp. CFBP13512]TKJ83839.1 hypothetical protein PaeCFBP13512_22220 [Paenibacillus sp. CFBP13512]
MLTTKMYDGIPIFNPSEDEAPSLLDFGLIASVRKISIDEFMERPSVFITNDPIQRTSEVWNAAQTTVLALSLIEKVDIGNIKVQKISNEKAKRKNFVVIDGSQRLTNIKVIRRNQVTFVELDNFVQDENGKQVYLEDGVTPKKIRGAFVLVEVDNDEDESIAEASKFYYNIAGLTFKELPHAFQRTINSYNLTIEEYEFTDPDIKKTLFHRWNHGTALNAAELRKVYMDEDLLNAQNTLKDLPVIQSGLSPTDIKRDVHSTSALSVLLVIQTNNKTKLTNNVVTNKMHSISPGIVKETLKAAECLNNIYLSIEDEKKRKSLFSKYKMIAMVYAIHSTFNEINFPDMSDLLKWIEDYFKEGGHFNDGETVKASQMVSANTQTLLHFKKTFEME